MKEILKKIGIGFFIFFIAIVGGLFLLSKIPSAPNKYWDKVETEAAIEKKYNVLGKYAVAYKKYDAPKDDRDKNNNHYVVYYPKEKGIYPLLVMVNGTGVSYNKYKEVFEHFASWGYVVIGNDYGTNWDGKHPSETLEFALNTAEIAAIIDKNRIAIGGHSQGGMGAFNAITEYTNGNMYKAVFAVSPTNAELALGLQWGFELATEKQYAYNLKKITIPTMIIAGTGAFDNDTVSPLEKMKKVYDELSCDKVMFRRSDNIDHGNMLYEANGYIIAWLDLYLKDITENEQAFYGANSELATNSRYQDYQASK